MDELKQTLRADYDSISEQIKGLEPKDTNYELLLEERDKLRNELLKLEQAKMEAKIKKSQMEAEDKREKIRNGITIGTFVVTTGVGIWTVIKTFKFDQDSTITSTLGRNSLNNLVSGMTKWFRK